jgi:DNA-binding NtrC family response regulator
MLSLSLLVVGNKSRGLAELTSALGREFDNVRAAFSFEQAGATVREAVPDAVIVDLETLRWSELRLLTRELALPVICTHRVPDEEMWTAALDAGALDVCPDSDTAEIVSAIRRHILARRSAAA